MSSFSLPVILLFSQKVKSPVPFLSFFKLNFTGVIGLSLSISYLHLEPLLSKAIINIQVISPFKFRLIFEMLHSTLASFFNFSILFLISSSVVFLSIVISIIS